MTANFEGQFAQMNNRLDHLGKLRAGWLNGAGETIDASTLSAVRVLCEQLHRLEIPRPRIYPTADGFVQLEWTSPPYGTSLRYRSDSSIYGIRLNVNTTEHMERDFSREDGIPQLAEFIVLPKIQATSRD